MPLAAYAQNECTLGTHNCDTASGATCYDTVASFVCECSAGYEMPACYAQYPAYRYGPSTLLNSATENIVTDLAQCTSTRRVTTYQNGDYADLGNATFGGTFSLSLWVKATGATATNDRVFDSRDITGTSIFTVFTNPATCVNQWAVSFRAAGASSLTTICSNSVIVGNTWTHLFVTLAGSVNVKIYVNSALTSTAITNIASNLNNVFTSSTRAFNRIGSQYNVASNSLVGEFADLRFYGRELSAPEIAQVYAGTSTFASDVIAVSPTLVRETRCARASPTRCVPENPCTAGSAWHNCNPSASCTDTAGSFTCACNSGYTGNGVTCTDVNECLTGTHSCGVSVDRCINTPGSFTCDCELGYSGDGITCTNIDECSTMTDDCDVMATCTDVPGSFVCACNVGYPGDGVICEDEDECDVGIDDCLLSLAVCENTVGSFTCTCNSGYDGDGVACTNSNECSTMTDDCDVMATCTDVPGSFVCSCNVGYPGDGVTCEDEDECVVGIDDCMPSVAACANTPGSFTCACNSGYNGNGVTCVEAIDEDECRLETHNCMPSVATCVDTDDSFTCTCNSGYTGNGVACTEDVPSLVPTASISWYTHAPRHTPWHVYMGPFFIPLLVLGLFVLGFSVCTNQIPLQLRQIQARHVDIQWAPIG